MLSSQAEATLNVHATMDAFLAISNTEKTYQNKSNIMLEWKCFFIFYKCSM